MKTAPLPALRKTDVGIFESWDGFRAVRFDVELPVGYEPHPEAWWLTYPDGTGRKVQDLARCRYFVRRHQETGW